MNTAMINNMTVDEKIRYNIPLQDNDLEAFKKEVEYHKEWELDKKYESALEQSEFRAEGIREILAICKSSRSRYKETKSLTERIESYIENSYIEI